MRHDTLIFDPAPCGFPKPGVSLLPKGFSGLTPFTSGAWASRRHFRYFARARYALHQAYRQAGIGPGKRLLAPAYHCRTMLDPAIALNGDITLYPVSADLAPDLAALDALADQSATPVKALLVAHFFGFPAPLAELSAWCRQREIALIEDCSHTLLTSWHRPERVGRHGNWVVSSPYKFVPSPDGGLLYARDAPVDEAATLSSPDWTAELRELALLLKSGAERLYSCRPQALRTAMPLQTALAIERREPSGYSDDYQPALARRSACRVSQWIIRHADIPTIARRRRENYRRWLAATACLPDCRALFPALPDQVIPYMFPLLIDQPATAFYALKQAGLPIWRWDSLVASNCRIANDYRLRLLHLPCHQSLTERERDWMIDLVKKVGAGGTA